MTTAKQSELRRAIVIRDLLEACQEVVARKEGCRACDGSGMANDNDACGICGGTGWVCDATAVLQQVEEAIAKAEGEKP